jgi:hypothetical protein
MPDGIAPGCPLADAAGARVGASACRSAAAKGRRLQRSLASSLHVDVDVTTACLDETVPLVELLRPVEHKCVEAHWLPDGLCADKLPAQDLGTNASVLEFGEDQQFVQEDVVVVLGRPHRRDRPAGEFNDSERGPLKFRIKAAPLSAIVPDAELPRHNILVRLTVELAQERVILGCGSAEP